MINCENLVKYYETKKVVDGVSFSLMPGEITVVTGPSGAGKSSLLRIASLIESPSSGKIKVEDKTYHFIEGKNYEIREQFPKVGVVFQNLFLWPHLSNKQNILLPLKKNWTEKKQRDYEDLIKLFGLENLQEKFPNKCSVGQRQRVALVRAFLLDSSYLYLDEITSSLDIEQVGVLLKYLLRLKQEGKAIFIITHFLKFAHMAADQILFMEHGRIVEKGGKEILMAPKSERLKKFLNNLEYIIPQ